MPSAANIAHLGRLTVACARRLAPPRLVWACALVVMCALVLAFYAFPSEPGVRLAGLGLELCGLLLTVHGLDHTRRFFGQPSLIAVLQKWASERRKLRTTTLGTAWAIGRASGSGTAPAVSATTVNPNDPVEKQIETLTENLLRQQRDISSAQSELAALSQKVTEGLQKESAARSVVAANLEEKLERSLTDGIYEALVGLVWILCGTILSTMSQEISCLLLTHHLPASSGCALAQLTLVSPAS